MAFCGRAQTKEGPMMMTMTSARMKQSLYVLLKHYTHLCDTNVNTARNPKGFSGIIFRLLEVNCWDNVENTLKYSADSLQWEEVFARLALPKNQVMVRRCEKKKLKQTSCKPDVTSVKNGTQLLYGSS